MLFSSLPSEIREKLRGTGRVRHFTDEQIIQSRGEMADGFWLIEEGSVMVGQFLPDGDFRGIAVLGPGDSYGELALFSQRPRVVDAVSRGDCRARYIAGRHFFEALRERPESAIALLGTLSAQLQEVLDLLAGMRRGTNAARLAGLLANLAAQEDGAEQEIAITQQELADLLGVTRATANAAVRSLEEGGLVARGYGTVRVQNLEGLRLFALA